MAELPLDFQDRSEMIEWNSLQDEAIKASKKAYAPYSNFPVGAAGLVSDGRIVSGCNIENASYGLTLCAECSMISNLLMSGGGRLVAVVCVDDKGELLSPCGRCRQLLFEHGGNELQLLTPSGPQDMSVILPWGFGPYDLEKKK
jgi:cytidine deaminase